METLSANGALFVHYVETGEISAHFNITVLISPLVLHFNEGSK